MKGSMKLKIELTKTQGQQRTKNEGNSYHKELKSIGPNRNDKNSRK